MGRNKKKINRPMNTRKTFETCATNSDDLVLTESCEVEKGKTESEPQDKIDPEIKSIIVRIANKVNSETYCADIDENSTQEEIERERQKIYEQGGLMTFALNTDYIHKSVEIEADRLRCEKIDDKPDTWLVFLIIASVLMGLELYKFISVLISFIIWR